MNRLFFTILILLALQNKTFAQDLANSKNQTLCKGYIMVYAYSNIDQLEFYTLIDQKLSLKVGDEKTYSLKLPIEQFSCDKSIYLNKFFDLLQADTFPFIIIEFPKDKLLGPNPQSSIPFKITITDRTKTYNIPIYQYLCPLNNKIVLGSCDIKLSDFNIDYSKKIFGIIKIKDKVTINFAVKLE